MQPRRWADVPDSMNWSSEQQRLTLGQDDYPVGPMGPEASTPAPRRELFEPPRWHYQPPRGVRYGLPTGTRPGYPEDTPGFVPPQSPPPSSPVPIFVQLRNVTSRSTLPNVQRRPKRTVSRSVIGSYEPPLRPLLFDQLPSHRHTYGGADRHVTAPQVTNRSIPENLHQYQFQPLILNRQPDYYASQPLYPAISMSSVRPSSLPVHISQIERRIGPEIMFPRRLIGERSSYPMGPPVMSSTLIAPPNLPADVTLYSVPKQFDHVRPYEPLSQTVLRRIPAPPIRPSPPPAALQRSLSVPSLGVIIPQNIGDRHTYGGLDINRPPRRRDRSVPAYFRRHQQSHAVQPIMIRTPTSSFPSPVVTDRTYPLRAPPSALTFTIPATDADVTYLTKPSEVKPGRSFEPLSQSIVDRIPTSPVLETDLRTQPIVDHLKRKLAQVEADKFVEKMTLNELRAKVEEDTRRYENELQHAHELHNEMMKYKSLLAEMELKNETLRKAIELEKRRYAYMEKMKNATADMLTEREVGMKLVEEEKQKYNSLRDMCQQLEAMAIETENEIRNLENSVEYKKAMAKKRELDGYEGRLEAEQKAAADLWREVEAEKQLNRHLTEQLKIHEEFTNDKRQALQVILDDKKRLQAIIDELMVKLDRLTYEKQMARKKLEMARRKHADLTKDSLEQSPTNTLEKENAMLKLQLKQAELQLQALASDTPLKLKLKEANSALQKLVAEREQLQSHLSYLEEQKEILNRTLSNIRQENDDLRQQLKGGPKILVTDGHMEDVNAKYASERAAWLKEKEMLQKALAQASRPHSLSDFDSDLHHILKRYLRAESYRKSLAWQKQYLLVAIAGYKEEESSTIKKLKECVGHTVKEPSVRINKFKVAALVIVCISRMINIVEHRRGSRQSTYDILYKALSKSKKLPYKCHPDTETNLWERPGESPLARWPLLVPSTPGCVSEYLERFNEMQNRIRRTLASNNT